MEEFLGTDALVSAVGGGARKSAVAVSASNPLPVMLGGSYASPNGRSITTGTTLDSLFSDDFGGSAVSTGNWDVLDGGLAANANLGSGVLAQGKIGSGITGMTESVSGSALTVGMGTTLGAERWYLSKQVFAGKEDVLVVMSVSQHLVANDVFVGVVEIDPITLVPILNPNYAADGNGSADFTNRGGMQIGLTVSTTQFTAEAVADSSSSKASGNNGAAGANTNTVQEYLIEIDSRDVIVSNAAVDSTNAKGQNASRVSTQCPNDRKLYKLLMRFRNATTPGSNTNVVVQRVLVVDNYEQRVQLSTAEGDQVGCKALAVNVLSLGAGASATQNLGVVALGAQTASGGSTYFKATSAATTNATLVQSGVHVITGGSLRNRAASERYFKLYAKASAPTVGTDTPLLTIGIPAASSIGLADFVGAYGLRILTGLAFAITGAYADSDTTAIAAGDVDVNLIYT